jgi:(2R)-ethylmalonyl-CoA mutase
MLAVTLSKDARARAVQLPAWNEALGLPRPWDQQWSLRLQQILAFETDLLEYDDIFNGSHVVNAKVEELKAAARAELARIEEMGGAVAAIDTSYMKQRLVESNARRLAAIEAGEQVVVGVNKFTESAPSPLTAAEDGGILTVDAAAERDAVERLKAWRAQRDAKEATAALQQLEADARAGKNVMEASIACAHAGVTTGEWGAALRRIYGEYRAPTGVARAAVEAGHADLARVRARVEEVSAKLGRRIKILVGKPGLDGHSNGAEQIAVRARDAGMEVVYEGIRLTPAEIANAALEEGVHVIGLSILSGSHITLVGEILERLKASGLGGIPLIVGGIIPNEDAERLKAMGVARVYTPKDYDIGRIMGEIVEIVAAGTSRAA